MIATVSRWGNSLGIRLPKEAVDSIHVAEGDRLNIQVRDESLVVTKLIRRYTLEELCAGMSEENSHPPMFTDLGGAEEWSY